jgi:hypothetical protein
MSDNKNEATFHDGHELPQYDIPRAVSPAPPGWGTPQIQYGITPRIEPLVRPASGAATWALVTGIVGLLVGWCTFGLPSIAAVILGHIGERQTKDDRTTGRGMAVTGLVLGYVGIVPAIVLTFWMIAGMGAAAVNPSPSVGPSYVVGTR